MADKKLVYWFSFDRIDRMNEDINNYCREHNIEYEDVSFNIYADGSTDLTHDD